MDVEVSAVVDVDVDMGVDLDVDTTVGIDSDVDDVETTGAVVTARTTVVSVPVVDGDVEAEVDAEGVRWDVDA